MPTVKTFKRILVTTDLSPESLDAVSYAGRLARNEGAALTLCYVPPTLATAYSHITPTADMVAMDADVRRRAAEMLDQWGERHLKNVRKVDTVLGDGVPHEEICRIAADIDAGVIVIATHGRRGFSHALLGSVAERVIRDAPCPVLVVRPQKPAAKKKTAARKATKKSAGR
jgi:nucleotide-binding universal stress UspA family protein